MYLDVLFRFHHLCVRHLHCPHLDTLCQALAVDLTDITLTVTAFTRPIYTCVLKGAIDPAASLPRTKIAAALGAPPVISVELEKTPGPRWNGLIDSIGERP